MNVVKPPQVLAAFASFQKPPLVVALEPRMAKREEVSRSLVPTAAILVGWMEPVCVLDSSLASCWVPLVVPGKLVPSSGWKRRLNRVGSVSDSSASVSSPCSWSVAS